jgi:4-amino-4-deoxy-L-arabinose transferase-like glycosyltransferase
MTWSIMDGSSRDSPHGIILDSMSEPGRDSAILLGLTLILFLLCAGLWSLAIPPFETPDEPGHARFVNFLLERQRLPVAGEEAPGEAHQPPLYYALAAALARVFHLDPIRVEPARNPAFRWYGGTQENKYLHEPSEDAATLRRLRLLSVALGAGTVALIYLMGVASGALSPRAAVLVAAFAAFLPQFTFISGSLNNDSLANFLAAGALASLAAALRRPSHRALWGLAGILAGLGLLAKFTGLALLPCGAIALLLARRVPPEDGGFRRGAAPAAALFFLPALLIPAPLWARNGLVLGDPLGLAAQVKTLPNLLDPKNLASGYFFTEFPVVLFESFCGRFGWMSLRLPAVLYIAALAATLTAVAGLILMGRQRRDCPPPRAHALLWAAVAVQLAQIVVYNMTFTQAQGRFLFPVLGPIAILFCSGMVQAARRLGWKEMTGLRALVLIALLAGANLCLLRLLVMPAYRLME